MTSRDEVRQLFMSTKVDHGFGPAPTPSSKKSIATGFKSSTKSQLDLDMRNFGIANSYITEFTKTAYKYAKPSEVRASKVTPKEVLPYFMELVLANQVRTKASEEAIANAAERRKAEAEEELADAEFEAQELEEQRLELEEKDSDDLDADDYDQDSDEDRDDQEPRERQPRRQRQVITEDSDEDDDESLDGEGADGEGKGDQEKAEKRPESPKKLQTVAARDIYMSKEVGRRGAVGNAAHEVTSSMHRRFSRTAWRHAINNLEPEYRLPALILKKHLYVKKEGPTRLGPGTYDIDYNQVQDAKKNWTTRGNMSSCSLRFPKEMDLSDTPGPGAYGTPQEAVERANDKYKHPGKVSLFRSGRCDVRGDIGQPGGSGLSPGYYDQREGIRDILEKVVSLRGPYDLYTPDRLTIPFGYHKSAKPNPLCGPGTYGVRKTMKQEWNLPANRYKGIFSPFQRDRRLTGERIVLVAPLWPVNTGDIPGPGQYDPRPHVTDVKQNKFPFNSNANLRSELNGDYDMAPNRYRVDRPKYCPMGCGQKSAFRSKTDRLDPLKIAVMTERLRGKDIPQDERIAWNTR